MTSTKNIYFNKGSCTLYKLYIKLYIIYVTMVKMHYYYKTNALK